MNVGRFGPYLKCENKSARLENVDELFTIGLNRAVTLIAEAKPGRISSSMIKDLGEHPEDKKPVRIMKGQYGPYIKYKSLNATIPEEKDPVELTMEEALILIEKRKEYDKNKKRKKNEKSIYIYDNIIFLSSVFICIWFLARKSIAAMDRNILFQTGKKPSLYNDSLWNSFYHVYYCIYCFQFRMAILRAIPKITNLDIGGKSCHDHTTKLIR